MNSPFQQSPVEGIKHIVLVGSGKGGVGKSTMSLHLAHAMSTFGHKVGILDADIYGPSLPRLLGLMDQKPDMSTNQKMIPMNRYGLTAMSMGFLMDQNSAVIWRGPMLFKALDQLFKDVEWGELDYLFIDLPPGTGDVQLTIAQKVQVSGAILITTPQNMALMDVRRAADMFQKVNIPILGLIENMAYFQESETSNPIPMFQSGELNSFLDQNQIPKLGEFPFFPPLGKNCEMGIPFTETSKDSKLTEQFKEVARKIDKALMV